MSSPFANLCRELRIQADSSQLEFAKSLGYEQAYISAIELGKKTPSREFVERLMAHLQLSGQLRSDVLRAVDESRRRFVLPAEVPIETYRLCHELWRKIDSLHPAQITALRELIKLDDQIRETPRHIVTRIRRKRRREAEM